jgi:hypothetical protein
VLPEPTQTGPKKKKKKDDVEIIIYKMSGCYIECLSHTQKFTQQVDLYTCADVITGYTYTLIRGKCIVGNASPLELFPFCSELFSVLGSRNLVSWSGHYRRWELLTLTMRHGCAFFSKV